jgi:hypothetical protein
MFEDLKMPLDLVLVTVVCSRKEVKKRLGLEGEQNQTFVKQTVDRCTLYSLPRVPCAFRTSPLSTSHGFTLAAEL